MTGPVKIEPGCATAVSTALKLLEGGGGQGSLVATLLSLARANREQGRSKALRELCGEHEKPAVSYRGNLVAAVNAETLWAVRTLRAASKPNWRLRSARQPITTAVRLRFGTDEGAPGWSEGDTNMDLLWAWLQALRCNSSGGSPLLVDARFEDKAAARNSAPSRLVGAMNSRHRFKEPWPWDPAVQKDLLTRGQHDGTLSAERYGLDHYVKDRIANPAVHCVLPSGEKVVYRTRHDQSRSQWYFQRRGRIIMPEASSDQCEQMKLRYCKSGLNRHAGIAEIESMPEEAKDVFGSPISHGKNLILRDHSDTSSLASKCRDIGAPFVGGASGSIQQFILTMEDDGAGAFPEGLVPYWAHAVREALIGLQTMTLVTGGQHSIAECLLVAQDMGYFVQVPRVVESYAPAAAAFERHLSQLGVRPASGSNTAVAGPLEQLFYRWDRFAFGPA